MVQLNFTNLDDKTQERLLSKSKKEMENRFGKQIRTYAKEHGIPYDDLLEEEAIRNLYNYNFVFRI